MRQARAEGREHLFIVRLRRDESVSDTPHRKEGCHVYVTNFVSWPSACGIAPLSIQKFHVLTRIIKWRLGALSFATAPFNSLRKQCSLRITIASRRVHLRLSNVRPLWARPWILHASLWTSSVRRTFHLSLTSAVLPAFMAPLQPQSIASSSHSSAPALR